MGATGRETGISESGGTCIAGNLLGKVGHDNGVSAVSSFTGYIRTIVRSDPAAELEVRATGLPPESRIEVRDPNNELVIARGPAPSTGDATYVFPLRGAGVYLAQASWTIRRSVNGAGRETLSYQTTLRATVRETVRLPAIGLAVRRSD